ncbi:transglycosylase domain-containing protein [Streptomyces sp. WMMC940]|uniref:transglycosylase domain-containing protein n=1 Tax=Streptomyces sp. WMMC940 TaxID=3015153 RepID=UPI0022B61643|nr:transglycosylase domain-containing protein [Streptomyces sp. WMMC940]MCZ7462091.1 transglycosylase domain-containing protein [Streptomyces sp. WMMC940]
MSEEAQPSRSRLRRSVPSRRRRIDYPRRGRQGFRRWLPSWKLLLGAFSTAVVGLLALFAAVYAYVDIPSENAAARQEANVYYWSDGTQMVSVGAVNRQNLPLSRIPVSVRNAAIAAENARFYEDSGVSVSGLARAVANMARGQETQGGSTITQQYVKNTYLSQEQTLSRKVQEFCIALKLDSRKTKDEILQGYLNTSWFGRGAYGIQAASNAYYGIGAEKLNPSQGAFLAALLKGGNDYDPALGASRHKRAVERWSWILDRQVELGMMSAGERARYKAFPAPRPQSKSTNLSGQTGYLVDLAKRYVKKRTDLTDADLDRGGYRIHTTFDRAAVQQLERSVQGVLKRNIDPKSRAEDRHVQVGAASVRPDDGAIVAVYGGPDATAHFTNNADTSGVPAGSVFKPFVLAAALQHGAVADDGSVQAVSTESAFDESGRLTTGLSPVRQERAFVSPLDTARGLLTLRKAMAAGVNAPFERLGSAIGLARVEDMAVGAGMLRDSMAPRTREFPLGTSSPSAIRVAGSYATFAGAGVRHEPYSVTKVLRGDEPVAGLARPASRRVMDPEVALDVTSVLEDTAFGTPAASATGALGRFAGAATGRSDTQRAAWFAGYTGNLSTAVTMFRSQPGKPLLPMAGTGGEGTVRGSVFPARIWADYMTSDALRKIAPTRPVAAPAPTAPSPE